MLKNRIYGKAVAINTEDVKKFYDQRALMAAEKGWETVSLNAENPTVASNVYCYDRDVVLPMLNLSPDTRVLELGCGMGRWASILLPYCGAYCGVDFSEDMLKTAEHVCKDYLDICKFYHMSCAEAVQKGVGLLGGSFGTILFSGICIYINDKELSQIFAGLPDLCQPACTVCIKETAALSERLTLDGFPSEALKANYNAIYRTPAEYNQLFEPLLSAGFSIAHQDFVPSALGRKRDETNSWCTILRRG